MAQFLVVKERGNGYRCGCCRREWIETEVIDFDSNDDAKLYAEGVNEDFKITDDDDLKITEVWEVKEKVF